MEDDGTVELLESCGAGMLIMSGALYGGSVADFDGNWSCEYR